MLVSLLRLLRSVLSSPSSTRSSSSSLSAFCFVPTHPSIMDLRTTRVAGMVVQLALLLSSSDRASGEGERAPRVHTSLRDAHIPLRRFPPLLLSVY